MCSFNKEINRLRHEINSSLSNVFSSTTEISRLRKEINRLLSKECQIVIEKLLMRRSQNLEHSVFKKLVTMSVLGSSSSHRYH